MGAWRHLLRITPALALSACSLLDWDQLERPRAGAPSTLADAGAGGDATALNVEGGVGASEADGGVNAYAQAVLEDGPEAYLRFDDDAVRLSSRVSTIEARETLGNRRRASGNHPDHLPTTGRGRLKRDDRCGRAEFGESAEQTLKREMKEELDADVEVIRLLWFVENFFIHAGRQYHEIGLYLLMSFPPARQYLVQPGPFRGQEEAVKLTFQWFSRQTDVLSELPLLPSFLPSALQELPDSVRHVVQRDEEIG